MNESITYITECEECGCIISYTSEQITDYTVECPRCHTKCICSSRSSKYEQDEINNLEEK